MTYFGQFPGDPYYMTAEEEQQVIKREEAAVSHTPGPWTWTNRDLRADDYSYFVLFVRMDEGGQPIIDISIADARLIAAAPDLLSACDAALVELELAYPHDGEVLEQLRAAIAKAKG